MNQLSNSLAFADSAMVHPYAVVQADGASTLRVTVAGEGCRVQDVNGRWYLDAMAGLWCSSLGFNNKRVADAVHAQMLRLPTYHVFADSSNEPAIRLTEKLIALTPDHLTRVLYANSGSEANDAAIKLVWYYNDARGLPAKRKIIGRDRGYHGVTIASASATGQPINHGGFGIPLDGFLHTDCPSRYHNAVDGESEEQFVDRLVGNLEALIEREGADTIGAFIAEPINGAGGIIFPPAGYFEAVQSVLKKHDILLIADEVICGFGRTGAMFGSELYGMTPDMMTIAKGLSAAFLPISGLLMTEEIFTAVSEQSKARGVFGHGVTYAAHPACAAAALEVLTIYEEMDIVATVRRVAPVFHAGLARFRDHPLVGDVRSVGLLGAVELSADPASRRSFDPRENVGRMVQDMALARGLILRGMRNDIIGMSPPLIISEAEIGEIVSTLGAVLDDALPILRDRGLVPTP